MIDGNAILLCIAIPAVGALLVTLTGRWPNLREAVSISSAMLLFALVAAAIAPGVSAGGRPVLALLEVMPGLSLTFTVEPLGLLFALIASFLWIVTTIYTIGYMRSHNERNQTRFYAFFAIALACVMGVAFAGNMLTLFVFYEALTLSTYPLVTHHGSDTAKRAGRIYLGILLATSIAFLLLAIVWTWTVAGTLDFTPGGILEGKLGGVAVAVLLGLYAFGIGKAALMPFHRWLPAAMVAPTPVSALLHAVAVVKAGVFAVLKVVVYIFGPDLLTSLGSSVWLQYVAAATILIASLVALRQDNLKLRLAYSTISQLAYVILGAMLANGAGIMGGGMQITTHAFAKITLFFCAGAILVASHKSDVSQMHGLGRAMPFTMAAFLIGSLSIVGLPPFGGVWSKWYLALGAIEAGQLVLVIVLMLSSLLSLAYLLPIPLRAFYAEPKAGQDDAQHGEAPLFCLIAIGVTALSCVALFFAPDPIYWLLQPLLP